MFTKELIFEVHSIILVTDSFIDTVDHLPKTNLVMQATLVLQFLLKGYHGTRQMPFQNYLSLKLSNKKILLSKKKPYTTSLSTLILFYIFIFPYSC